MSYLSLTLCKIAVAVLAAWALYLCVNRCGQTSLGHAGFMALGAYAFAWLSGFAGWHGFFAVLGAAGAVFLVTLPLGFLILRLQGDYLAAATLGIGELIRILLSNFTLMGGAGGTDRAARITTPLSAGLCVLAAALGLFAFSRSPQGLLARATAVDATAAEACGVNTLRLKTVVFAVSAAVAAVAGCLYAGAVGFICPNDFPYARACESLAAVTVGGESAGKVMLAAAALEVLSAVLPGYAEIKMLLWGMLLIVGALHRRKMYA